MLATPSRLRGPGEETIEKGSGIERPWERAPPGDGRNTGAGKEDPAPAQRSDGDGGDGTASSGRSVFNFPKRLGCSFPSLTAVEVRGTEEENALFILFYRRES